MMVSYQDRKKIIYIVIFFLTLFILVLFCIMFLPSIKKTVLSFNKINTK